MKKNIFLIPFFLVQILFAQQTESLKIKKYKIATLSDSLRESSGLNFFKGNLYTFNDSGNTSEIFQIDKNSGKILMIIKTNLKNTDWEAITSDSTQIYIGDFGNNAGTRKDLKIYKIEIEKKLNGSKFPEIRKAELEKEINFFYPQQKDFSSKNLNNDFDGEAMIFLNKKLHIFTKEWKSKSVTHYLINPEISGNQAAEKVESFKTNFVVTDASYFDKKLYLVGYTKKAEVFLDIFKETKPGIFFEENPKKYNLGNAISIGQIEGIAVNEDGIYFSNEKFHTPLGTVLQSLYFVPKEKL